MVTLPKLTPDATGTISGVTGEGGGTTNLHTKVTDGSDATYITSGVDLGGSIFFRLSDVPADFDSMDTLGYEARLRLQGTVADDTMTLSCTVFDGNSTTTALTDTVQIATQANAGATFNLKTGPFTIQGTPTKAQWNNAHLRLTWTYAKTKSSDGLAIRVSETAVTGTYTASSGTTVSGTPAETSSGSTADGTSATLTLSAVAASATSATDAAAAHEDITSGSLDFTEYALNADPAASDWTAVGSTGGVDSEVLSDATTPGGRRWNLVSDAAVDRHIWYSFDGLNGDADTEALILAKRTAAATNIVAAAVQTQATETYMGGFRNNSTDGTVRHYDDTFTATTLSNTAHGGLDPTVYHWIRTRRNGTAIQTKLWVADLDAADFGMSDEPGTWLIDTTDSTLSGAGSIGWFAFATGSAAFDVDMGWFGWATQGETAPGPASGGTTVSGTPAGASSASDADGATGTVTHAAVAAESSSATDAAITAGSVTFLAAASQALSSTAAAVATAVLVVSGVASPATSASEADAATGGSIVVGSPAGASSASTADGTSGTVDVAGTPAEASSGTSADATTATVVTSGTPVDATSATDADAATGGSIVTGTPDGTSSGTSADGTSGVLTVSATPADGTSATGADGTTGVLTVAGTPAAATSGTSADGTTGGTSGTTVAGTPADASSGTSSDATTGTLTAAGAATPATSASSADGASAVLTVAGTPTGATSATAAEPTVDASGFRNITIVWADPQRTVRHGDAVRVVRNDNLRHVDRFAEPQHTVRHGNARRVDRFEEANR